MGDLQATTLTGRETTLPAAAVEAFQQSLRGQLIAPDDTRYAEARQVWNANIDRWPGLICRPTGVANVRPVVLPAEWGRHAAGGHGLCPPRRSL